MQFQTAQYDSAEFQSLGKVTIVTKAHLSLNPRRQSNAPLPLVSFDGIQELITVRMM
jgi:hypothetical protein